MHRKRILQLSLAVCGATLLATAAILPAIDDAAKEDKALKLAQREAKILDGIYKNAIVLVTKHYVNDDNDIPAGVAFKKLFEAAAKNGWHEVRLLDATDDPYNDENAPADKFEKAAIKALLDGKANFETIVKKEGKRFLRIATPVPVVMDKCVMCHPHYEDVKEGTPIGALSYTIPIQD